MKEIAIGRRQVGPGHPPLIVAEMSGNHNRSLARALEIVDAAARSGAHALKIQTYTADTMTLDVAGRDFSIDDPGSPWQGYTLHRLYEEAHTPWEWHRAIFERCQECGMICFSTPFDATAVDFLESLGSPCYKVASFECTDIPLVRKAASTGKPLIVSTGMATVDEIAETVGAAREAGGGGIVLLKCTSTYPADPGSTNIMTIPDMRDRFGVPIGLSDHTMGIGVAVASVALGAAVIEKHFTLRRADGGVDAAFSMEPEELRALVVECDRAWRALGSVSYGPVGAERASLRYRRSLYVIRDVAAGERFTRDNVRAIRPGFGIAPRYQDAVLGRRALTDIRRGTALTWALVEGGAPGPAVPGAPGKAV